MNIKYNIHIFIIRKYNNIKWTDIKIKWKNFYMMIKMNLYLILDEKLILFYNNDKNLIKKY